MKIPMLGGDYINKLFSGTTGKLKKLAKPLFKDGIGDLMDKGNLFIVPGFTLLAFAVLWTTKLSKISLDEATCKGASIFDLTGTKLDEDAQKHCQTAKRYYVMPNEPFPHETDDREQRTVKNPEWVLWFWAPIVFVMYVLTRFIWSLLLDNQGINFSNVVNASQSVMVDNEGVSEVDEDKLVDRLPTIADNNRCAASSHAFACFIAFEFFLMAAPLFLTIVVLPLMIGSSYRTYGIDVAKAWWDNREWKGVPLDPSAGLSRSNKIHLPLIPRITYCDYTFDSLRNSNFLTYRCYLDANWHERTALFTWAMLIFIAFINFCNLFFWVLWTFRMKFPSKRKKWVIKKWLDPEGFTPNERKYMPQFAETFKMGNLLLFYYIEAHTDRTVASAFCTALFQRWLEMRINEEIQENARKNREVAPIPMSPIEPTAPPMSPKASAIGWDLESGRNGIPESWPPEYTSRLQSEEPSGLPQIYLPRIYSIPRMSRYQRKASYDTARRRSSLYYDRYDRVFKEKPKPEPEKPHTEDRNSSSESIPKAPQPNQSGFSTKPNPLEPSSSSEDVKKPMRK